MVPAFVAGGTAVVLAAVVSAWVINWPVRPPVPPEAAAPRVDYSAMKADADVLALRGDIRGAYEGYKRLLDAAAKQDGAGDPQATAVVASARAAQDRLVEAAIAKATAVPVTPVAPPMPTPPVPTESTATRPSAPPTVADTHRPFADWTTPTPATAPTRAAATAPAQSVADVEPPNPADVAPPVAHPPPPPQLRAYTLQDGVSDEEIGEAIDRAITYLRAHGGVTAAVARGGGVGGRGRQPGLGRGPAAPQVGADGGPDLDGGSSLGSLPMPSGPPNRGLPGGGPPGGASGSHSDLMSLGPNLLATYALLNAGQSTNAKNLGVHEPAVAAALEQIKQYALTSTYTHSLRAAALAVYDRPEDRNVLEADVAWLVAAHRQGGYTYSMPTGNTPPGFSMVPTFQYDNSNSQYGLFGVWSGAQAGVSVASNYWSAVAQHWTQCATPAGTWGYRDSTETGYLSMTLAGVASLLVSHEYLDAAAEANATPRPPAHSSVLEAGLRWLDQGDNCLTGIRGSMMPSYTTYGLERVGLASGFKYFGRHDWYAEIARQLVNAQRSDGSWRTGNALMDGDGVSVVCDTAYYLLFLARGRHPILFNKLRYDGDWDDRPHDVAHLARFTTAALERPLNWQVVNLRRNWFDWMDSPVLYISGDQPPKMTDADVLALRNFALGGGLIFTHADGGSRRFSTWVNELVRKAFPKYELTRVPRNHPLNTVLYHLKDPPPLEVVNNGSRILLVHCPTDIAGGWQLDWTDERRPDFELGANLFVYAGGKADFKNRLASTYIPPWPDEPTVTRPVARLRYAGEWDPEPYAWTRFARYFTWETHDGLDVQTVDLDRLQPGQVPAAFLTGTVRQDFTDAEVAAAKAYVEAGGVLVIDACGGQASFTQSIRDTLLSRAFPGVTVGPLPPDHPLFVASRPNAHDLRRMPLRPFASERLQTDTVPIEGAHVGRGWVIFSRLDLITGLLGTESWGILGYRPAYAQALVENAVLWAGARAPAAPQVNRQ